MATVEFSPIVDQAAFVHDLSEVDLSVYAMEQSSAAPSETEVPATERAHTAAVMDTDK